MLGDKKDVLPSGARLQFVYDPNVKPVVGFTRMPVTTPTLGRTVPLDSIQPPEPELQSDAYDSIEIDIPDDDEDIFEEDDDINFTPPSKVRGENEIDVPEHVLRDFNTQRGEQELLFREALMRSASLLYAHDKASNFVETALRDGLGLLVELDDQVQEAFVVLSRLEVLTTYIQQMHLSEKERQLLINRMLVKGAEDSLSAIIKKQTGNAQSEMLRKLYAARVQRGDKPEADPEETNTVGVRTSRR